MRIWQCSCTCWTCGFARPPLNHPGLSAAFPLGFLGLIHYCLAGCPQVGGTGGKHSNQPILGKAMETQPPPWTWRTLQAWGKALCNRDIAQPLLQRPATLDLLSFLVPQWEAGKAWPKAGFFPLWIPVTTSLLIVQITWTSPICHMRFLYITGDGPQCIFFSSFGGSIRTRSLLWTVGFCSSAINQFYYSGFGFSWLLRQQEGDVFYPSLAPEEAALLRIPRCFCVATFWPMQELVLHLGSVSKALLMLVKSTWLQKSVTGWFVSASELLLKQWQ